MSIAITLTRPERKTSSCCGSTDRDMSDGDGPDFSDLGICSDCGDHCEYGYWCEGCGGQREEDEEYCEACAKVYSPQTDADPVNTMLAKSAAYIGILIFLAGWAIGAAMPDSFWMEVWK